MSMRKEDVFIERFNGILVRKDRAEVRECTT